MRTAGHQSRSLCLLQSWRTGTPGPPPTASLTPVLGADMRPHLLKCHKMSGMVRIRLPPCSQTPDQSATCSAARPPSRHRGARCTVLTVSRASASQAAVPPAPTGATVASKAGAAQALTASPFHGRPAWSPRMGAQGPGLVERLVGEEHAACARARGRRLGSGAGARHAHASSAGRRGGAPVNTPKMKKHQTSAWQTCRQICRRRRGSSAGPRRQGAAVLEPGCTQNKKPRHETGRA